MHFHDLASDRIQKATSTLWFRDAGGVRHEVSLGQRHPAVTLEPRLAPRGPGRWQLGVRVRNTGPRPLFLQELAVLDVCAAFGGALDLGGHPTQWTLLGMPLSVSGGVMDLCIQRFEYQKYDFFAADYLLIGNRAARCGLLAGFLSARRQLGSLRLSFDHEVYCLERFRASCALDGYRLDPGESLESEPLFLNLADAPEAALEDYAARIARRLPRPPRREPVTGWGSWDYYLGRVTEDDVLENARWLAEHRAEFPVEYIQLDHGFQRCEGDWLTTNERFPHGLKWLAGEIRALGFKPGLWLCPFLAARESAVYGRHPDWVIRDRNGEPVQVAGYAVKQVYPLDCSQPAVRAWVRALGRAVARDCGFAYVKLDGANVQPMVQSGVLANPTWTKARALRAGLEAFRAGLGRETFLLNGCLYGQSQGLTDAMRIGGDVGARWDASRIDKHHGERDNYPGPGYMTRAILATTHFAWQNRRWWLTDPDYLVVRPRGDRSELTLDEARAWASVVGLNNGLIILSDRLRTLPPERLAILRSVLPPYPGSARTLDLFQTETPTRFSLAVRHATERWHVIALLNMRRPVRARTETLAFEELGLDPARPYHVFDFWARAWRGLHTGRYAARLKPHQAVVLGIRAATGAPQVIGTDLHITQGGVEFKAVRFDARARRLVIQPAAIWKTGHVYVYLPSGWRPAGRARRPSRGVLAVPVTLSGGNKPIVIQLAQEPAPSGQSRSTV